jgi:hypothetical protein
VHSVQQIHRKSFLENLKKACFTVCLIFIIQTIFRKKDERHINFPFPTSNFSTWSIFRPVFQNVQYPQISTVTRKSSAFFKSEFFQALPNIAEPGTQNIIMRRKCYDASPQLCYWQILIKFFLISTFIILKLCIKKLHILLLLIFYILL